MIANAQSIHSHGMVSDVADVLPWWKWDPERYSWTSVHEHSILTIAIWPHTTMQR